MVVNRGRIMTGQEKKTRKIICFLFSLIILSQIMSLTVVGAYDLIKPYEPQEIEEGDIPYRPYGNSVPKEYRCYLEAGHKYHIFLVGDWITNNTEIATDYDIEVRNPSNVVVSINTESAGLPEQVANDAKHQYFVPTQTGDYRFIIYNDPKDSAIGEEDGAVFMIIEHLEMNTRYSTELKGKPSVGASYPDGNKIGYEFNTTESEFLLYIEVPDPVPVEGITGLDMYEARVFPMANPAIDVGYNIQDVGVPLGDYLLGKSTNNTYGKYNTSIPGFSYPNMRISCESAGVDMRRVIKMEVTNSTEAQNIFYYLVMLAEYFEGEVEFYMKTDYRAVNLTLIDPPEVGYTNQTTLIKVETESVAAVDSMWIEYSSDNWKTSDQVDLIDKTDYWLAALPSFDLHDYVEYKIHAEDEIDNKGVYEGNFTVMNKVEIDFGVSGSIVQGGQTVKITGAATKPSINLNINVEHGGSTSSINIQTDGDGVFTYDYKPTKIGEYDITISYAGDEDYHEAVSREKSFRVDKRKLELSCVIENEEIKVERPLTVSGVVSPAVNGLEVEFIFVSPETSFIETVTSDREGKFSLTITPEVLGYWDMLPQLRVSELFDTSQGEMITFEVAKLTPVDIVTYQAIKFTEPPLMYVAIGIGVVVLVILLQRFGVLDKLRRVDEDDPEEDEEDESEKPSGAISYKRRSAR